MVKSDIHSRDITLWTFGVCSRLSFAASAHIHPSMVGSPTFYVFAPSHNGTTQNASAGKLRPSMSCLLIVFEALEKTGLELQH